MHPHVKAAEMRQRHRLSARLLDLAVNRTGFAGGSNS
jgi:hypothetical protein